MDISRRTTMKLLGSTGVAAGALSLPACGDPLPPKINARIPHVNLICHGMMLFHYPLPKDNSTYPDHLLILIPAPPQSDDGKPQHLIAMSQYRTGYRNQLVSQGRYELVWGNSPTFTRAASSFFPNNGSPVSSGDRVLLYNSNLRLTCRSDFQNPQPSDYVWYSIKVPYPTYVFPYDRFRFPTGHPAYAQMGAAKDFSVNPSTMAGMHVFYYQGVLGQLMLNVIDKYGSSTANPMGPIGPTFDAGGPAHWNIHLYSEPATWVDYVNSKGHIGSFNNIVTYTPPSTGVTGPLDLKPATLSPPMVHDSKWPIDRDLDAEDHMSLAEIYNGPKPANTDADPVECLQGWGT